MKNFFLIFIFLPCFAFAQITVSNSSPHNSINNLINGVLMNSVTGNAAQNVVLHSGQGNQIGFFNGQSSNVGIGEGVLLSTGGIGKATPQSDGNEGVSFSSNDPDLSNILQNIAGSDQQQKNAIVVEFDFVAGGDFVEFEYVFASNEYQGFTCSKFNDVFGFFLSGPGISGPYSGNSKNIALVPNPSNPLVFTTTPVMINTVNSGSPTGTNSDASTCNSIDPNWTSYSTFFVQNSAINTVNFNGFTKPLKAKSNVICGETYHIKMAIADVGDDQFNSAVFLKKGSFEVGTPLNLGIIGQYDFVKCVDRVEVNPLISGGFGTVITEWTHNGVFFSNDQIVTLIDNGLYKVTVTDDCGSISHTISVSDYTPLVLSIPDTVILCNDFTIIPDLEGGAPQYEYSWQGPGLSSSLSTLPLSPGYNGLVTLEIKDNCKFSISDDVFIFTPEELSVDAVDYVYLCERELIIEGEYSGGYGEVVYYWEFKGVKTYDFSLNLTDVTSGTASFHAIDDCGKHRIHYTEVKSPGPIYPIEISFNSESDDGTYNICSRDVFGLPITVTGGAGNQVAFKWYLDEKLVSTLQKYQFDGSQLALGEHTVKLELKDVCDNELSQYFKINRIDCTVPNVITPSSDHVNDAFYFPIGDLQGQIELSVYDRWGIQVYYNGNYERCSKDAINNCWHGQYRDTDKASIDGVYFYIITFSKNIVEKGVINVFNE